MRKKMQLQSILLLRRLYGPIYFQIEFPWNETPLGLP